MIYTINSKLQDNERRCKMLWPFTVSPEVVVERELRDRLLEKGVNRRRLLSILETDKWVALRAIRTGRAADSRECTYKNMTRIVEGEKRFETASGSIRDLLSGK